MALPQSISLCLTLLHKTPVSCKFLVHLAAQRTWLHGALEQQDATIDGTNGCFLSLEIATGGHQVENRRHKIFVLRLAIERTGKSSKETQSIERFHYEDSKHLAPLQLIVPFSMPSDVTSHLVGCCNTKRMGFVAKRISKLLRSIYLFNANWQRMQAYSHKTPSGP